MFTFLQRTYGKWWDMAPSRVTDIMPQTLNENMPQDFIGNQMFAFIYVFNDETQYFRLYLSVVEFEDFVFPSEISIYETYNPGAVVKLWAFTINEKWTCLWESDEKNSDNNMARQFTNDSHIFSPPIKEIKIPTRIIRIEFNHRNSDYFTEIDGVVLEGVKFTPRGDLQQLMNLSQTNKGPIQRKLEKVSFTPVPAPNQSQDQLLKDFLIKDLEHFIAKINCNDRGLSPSVPDASEKNPSTLKNMPVSIRGTIAMALSLPTFSLIN